MTGSRLPTIHRKPRLGIAFLLVVGTLAFSTQFPASVEATYVKPRPVMVSLSGSVPAPVRTGALKPIGQVPQGRRMVVALALELRHAAALQAFIDGEAAGHRPMTRAYFRTHFSPTSSQIGTVLAWGRLHGLVPDYVAPDRLIVTLSGRAAAVSKAFATPLLQYRVTTGAKRLYGQNGLLYGNAAPVTLPSTLHVHAVVGLDNMDRFARFLHHGNVPLDGYLPQNFRDAYDVDGSSPSEHAGSGLGQTIGLTDFGGRALPQSDFNGFAAQSSDTAMKTCAVTQTGDSTTGVATPVACSGSAAPDSIQWVYVGGSNSDHGAEAQGETALDVEFAHGMAPGVHLKYFIANDTVSHGDATETYLTDALSQAENDPALHIVSDSWGVWVGGANDSFVQATQGIFEAAVAVGTTFYFSTGDEALDSGCAGARPTCAAPDYPASSPYVAAVGGTSLSMDSTFTIYDQESAWNYLESSAGGATSVEGGGAGCASYFSRPTWQSGLTSVSATASCPGRAIPDVSADADPASGALTYVQGQASEVGGTSLSAPLWAGMAASIDNSLAAQAKPLSGWIVPRLYSLAGTVRYNAYFHDVACGYVGYPAQAGWDEATGLGTPDWYAITQALAGTTDSVSGSPPSTCVPVSSASQLALPLANWPPGTKTASIQSGSEPISWLDSGNNFFHQFHSIKYKSRGSQGGLVQIAPMKIGSDSTPIGYYVGSYYGNSVQAVSALKDALAGLRKRGIIDSDCSLKLMSPGDSTPDCHLVSFVAKSGTKQYTMLYGLSALGNVLIEVALQVKKATFTASATHNKSLKHFRKLSAALIANAVTALNDYQPNDDG